MICCKSIVDVAFLSLSLQLIKNFCFYNNCKQNWIEYIRSLLDKVQSHSTPNATKIQLCWNNSLKYLEHQRVNKIVSILRDNVDQSIFHEKMPVLFRNNHASINSYLNKLRWTLLGNQVWPEWTQLDGDIITLLPAHMMLSRV